MSGRGDDRLDEGIHRSPLTSMKTEVVEVYNPSTHGTVKIRVPVKSTETFAGMPLETKAPEKINHPAHYGGDTVYEAIKVIEAWGLGFCLGNAVKYICRAGKKELSLLEDLKKARWYLDREIQRLS